MEQKEKNSRKVHNAVVVSNKMQKTVVVEVKSVFRHPVYGKVISRRKKFYAHHETPLNVGDEVKIIETRPLSKLKRWLVVS